MNKKFITLLIFMLTATLAVRADFADMENADFTGDAFFESSAGMYSSSSSNAKKESTVNGTIPPLKRLRLNIQNKIDERNIKNTELAPVQKEESIYASDKGTSKYVSKEIKEEFDEMTPDGFEADEEAVIEKNKKKADKKHKHTNTLSEETEDIILDCDNVDYDTPNYLIKAKGNVCVNFVNQKITVKADMLTFDRINNTVKAEGNVCILKNGRTVTGDYIFVDLNEENALIENPMSRSESIEIHSKKGYVYGDKIIQEQGQLEVVDDYSINFSSGKRSPQIGKMLTPKNETLTEDMGNGLIRVRADSIKIKQKGDLEVIALKKTKVSKGERAIIKIPSVKIYTNKNHDYAETNLWEVGNYRGLGLYTGPGYVFELPKGAALKAIPFLNYSSGFGVGGMGRFHSGTNETTVAYGTAADRFFVSGIQELDDNLKLNYSVNSYMDEWFLGRRRPKYGVSLAYKNSYASKGFLLPNKISSFSHGLDVGYFHDLDFDSHFEKINKGGTMGTTRFRYMAEVRQSLFDYENPEKMTAFSVDTFAQLATSIYGTGDTQAISKFGPQFRMQYKRWKQDVGYSFNAYHDESPFYRYDRFRYGKQYLYIREYFRLCRWLTVSWFGNINTTNDAYNHKTLQENSFYLSVGPDDFKLHLGYDFARDIFRAAFEVMMDAKGTTVEYNTFEIKQDKKAEKSNKPVEKKVNNNLAPTQPKVLNKAIIENIKVMDDVL